MLTEKDLLDHKDQILESVKKSVRQILKENQEEINTLMKKYDEELKNRGADAVDEETKKALEAKITEVNGRIDALQAERKRLTGNPEDILSFKTALMNEIDKNKENIQKMYTGSISKMKMHLSKAVLKDMTTPANLTGDLARTYSNEFVYPPFRKQHMRGLLPTGSLSTGIFTYPEKITTTGAPASQNPEGALKSQIDYSIEMKDAKAVTIAAFLVVSRQMLDDIEGLQSYLTLQMQEDLLIEEDRQILRGTGANNQLQGIEGVATSYTPTTGDEPDYFSILGNASKDLEQLNYDVTGILVNPSAWWNMVLNKETGAGFSRPLVASGQMPLVLAGIPVLKSTAIVDDTSVLGDFGRGAQLLFREGLSIEMSMEDNTNFRENKITFRVEERVAMPIYHPTGFKYVTTFTVP